MLGASLQVVTASTHQPPPNPKGSCCSPATPNPEPRTPRYSVTIGEAAAEKRERERENGVLSYRCAVQALPEGCRQFHAGPPRFRCCHHPHRKADYSRPGWEVSLLNGYMMLAITGASCHRVESLSRLSTGFHADPLSLFLRLEDHLSEVRWPPHPPRSTCHAMHCHTIQYDDSDDMCRLYRSHCHGFWRHGSAWALHRQPARYDAQTS